MPFYITYASASFLLIFIRNPPTIKKREGDGGWGKDIPKGYLISRSCQSTNTSHQDSLTREAESTSIADSSGYRKVKCLSLGESPEGEMTKSSRVP